MDIIQAALGMQCVGMLEHALVHGEKRENSRDKKSKEGQKRDEKDMK